METGQWVKKLRTLLNNFPIFVLQKTDLIFYLKIKKLNKYSVVIFPRINTYS